MDSVVWARLTAQRDDLLRRANEAMKVSNETGLNQDWQEVSELMQQQRDTILREVKEIQEATAQLETEEVRCALSRHGITTSCPG